MPSCCWLLSETALAVAFGGVSLLFLAFAAWMLWTRWRGLLVRCACFGRAGRAIGASTVLRNLGLSALTAVAAVAALTAATFLPPFDFWFLVAATTLGAFALFRTGFTGVVMCQAEDDADAMAKLPAMRRFGRRFDIATAVVVLLAIGSASRRT